MGIGARMSSFSGSGNPRRGLKATRRWKMGRLATQAQNNLGIVMTDTMNSAYIFRKDFLDILDQYYEGSQYDDLTPWEEACKGGADSQYIPIRERQPRVNYNVAKVVVNKVAAKLVGVSAFPQFVVESDPDDTAFFRAVAKACDYRRSLIQPMKHLLTSGSVLIRYSLVGGFPRIEHYNSKYCYPEFNPQGELDSVSIKYVYEDQSERDSKGNFKQRWYRLDLNTMSDILYDNPEYVSGNTEPEFQIAQQTDHGLGWVQAEWFRTAIHKHDPDGYSILADVLEFFDELNYSLSQTSQAIQYNQDPQLLFKNISEEELENLIRSSQKGWDLGREGEATFLESDLNGVEMAEKQRDHMRNLMLDVIRVVLHDPEKMVAAAQSGRALEILNAPLVELVDEIRSLIEPSIKNLLIKIAMTMLKVMAEGLDTVLTVPDGFMPTSLDITVNWPPMYPLTLDDITKKVSAAVAATTAHVISHKTATQWVARDFGVEDIDEELAQIATEAETMPWLQPFGGMGFGEGQ